jgi:hypothetical protein
LAKKKEKEEAVVKAPVARTGKPAAKVARPGKLPPKNKARLPRLAKKAKKKAEQKAKDSAAGRL